NFFLRARRFVPRLTLAISFSPEAETPQRAHAPPYPVPERRACLHGVLKMCPGRLLGSHVASEQIGPPAGSRQGPLCIRQHLPDVANVGGMYLGQLLQVAHTLGWLGSEQVTLARMHAQDLASGRDLKALGRAAMRLELPFLGHNFLSSASPVLRTGR